MESEPSPHVVRSLLRAEDGSAERFLALLRFLLVVGYAGIAYAVGSAPGVLLWVGVVCVLGALYSAVVLFLVRSAGIAPAVKYVSCAVDMALFTAWYWLLPNFLLTGGLLPYMFWITAAMMRFSLRLTLFAAIFGLCAFLVALVASGGVESFFGDSADDIRRGWLLSGFLIFVATAGFAVYVSSVYEGLVSRVLSTESQARLGEAERDDAQLEFSEKRLRMLESFSRFVPEQFLQFLGRNIVEVKLGDAVAKEMTLLFADIRDFSGFAEKMTPEETFRFLNAYLRRMGPVIHKENGFIDKFIGDEIMALFSDEPDRAIRAAIQMVEELRIYNIQRRSFGYEPVRAGIGLHLGNVMLGTVGSEFRLDTTVIGDAVNLASRIQNLTKIFRVPVILSDFVYRRLVDPSMFHFREIDSVRVKGKQNPVVLYEVYDVDGKEIIEKKETTLPLLQMAMYLYKAGNFDEAKVKFQECLSQYPEDSIPAIYIKRCDYLMAHQPRNWSGVSRMR